ncbi:restriction endonuclease subunit S [Sphingobacterium kitahiroshimense]|uniref:Restriction endonuclease subunit S n=1 Tax=Sphingobacterium kitahiroshimense TaxID=470446 RepID=A0ABV0C0S2_9SPHI
MWEKVKWRDVLDIYNGKNQSKVVNPKGRYPIYGSGGLMGYADDYLCPADTTIIGRKGSINNPIYVKTEFWNVDTAFGLVSKESLWPKYLYYFCKTFNFLKLDKSTTLPSLTKSDLLEIEIPLPPLLIQEKIADILDKADELRRKDKDLQAKYDKLAQAIFIDMFGDPVRNEKGWEVKRLNALCLKIGSGSTPSGGNESYKSEGISLIRSLNIHQNKFKYKDLAFIDDKQADKLKNVIVEENDVLFNITGASVCRTTVVPSNVLPARVNQHVAILRFDKQHVVPFFAVRLLSNSTMNRHLYAIATQGGATREAITKEQLQKLEIIVPPIHLQEEFAKKIEIINQLKAQINVEKSEQLFQALLQKAFKGELVNK